MITSRGLACPECGAALNATNHREECYICGYRKDWRGIRHGKNWGLSPQSVTPNQPNILTSNADDRGEPPTRSPESGEMFAATEMPTAKKAKPKVPRRAGRRISPINAALYGLLLREPDLSDLEVAKTLDRDGVELPKEMRSVHNNFETAFRNLEFKNSLQSRFSKIRKKIREKTL